MVRITFIYVTRNYLSEFFCQRLVKKLICFLTQVRIYQDVWDKIIKRQSTSNPSQQENRKDVSLQNVNWKAKKTGRHIKQARNRNREKTGNGFLLDLGLKSELLTCSVALARFETLPFLVLPHSLL